MAWRSKPPAFTPGYCTSVKPCSFSMFGKVTGSFACGATSPNSTSANASPTSSPGKKLVRIAGTASRHGVRIGPGTDITTAVLGFAAATAGTRASMLSSSDRSFRSLPSPLVAYPKTIATSAAFAAAAAAPASEPSLYVTASPRARNASSGETRSGGDGTWPEPPPAVYGVSAPLPISASFIVVWRGSSRAWLPLASGAFLSKTVDLAASSLASALCAGVETLWPMQIESKSNRLEKLLSTSTFLFLIIEL